MKNNDYLYTMEGKFIGFASIDDYINSLGENEKEWVYKFVAFMKTEFPKIIPKICFVMPMWWVGVKMYDGYVAIFSAHFSYEVIEL